MSVSCPYCNAENRDTARFCRNCGRPIESASGLPWPPPAGRRVALKEMSDAAITLPAERQQAIAQFKGVGILA